MDRTYTRWIPALSMMLVSVLSYMDRSILSLLSPTILREVHLTNQQYGLLISAFSIAYMLSNPVWGRILDRFGVRVGMAFAVTAWTIASFSHVFAVSFLGFIVVRAWLGAGEGATFPGCLRVVVQTLPVELRARGIAITYCGASLGAVITPIIITPIAFLWGWRSAFYFTALIGAGWLIVWAFLSRRVDLAQMPPETRADAPPRWGDRRIWAFVAVDALGSFPQALVNLFTANYLHMVMGKGQLEIGKVLWIPPLGWELGYFFWAWVTDRFSSSGRSIPALRKQFFCLMLLSLPVAYIPHIRLLPVLMLLMFFVMFVTAGFIITATAYRMNEWSGHAGLIGGMGAGSSAFVVAIMMPLFGRLFDLHRFNETFFLASLFPITGVSIWFILNRASASKQVLTTTEQ